MGTDDGMIGCWHGRCHEGQCDKGSDSNHGADSIVHCYLHPILQVEVSDFQMPVGSADMMLVTFAFMDRGFGFMQQIDDVCQVIYCSERKIGCEAT